MRTIEQLYRQRVAATGCVVCRLLGYEPSTAELHHVAEGSGKRDPFALTALCPEHHRGAGGLHGMGAKEFIRLYRIPGESEYGLLILTNRYRAELEG